MREIPKDKIKRIIIRTSNWLGDVIMNLNTIENIKQHFNNSTLTLLTPKNLEIIPRLFFPETEILSADFNSKTDMKRITREIKLNKYDLGIIFPLSFSSAYLFWKSNVKIRVGFNSELRGLFLNTKVPYSKKTFRECHLRKSFDLIFSNISKKDTVQYQLTPKLNGENIKNTLSKFNLVSKPYFILAPGATYGPAKRWNFNNFIDLANLIFSETGFTPVLTGLPNEIEITREIPDNYINLIGRTSLEELVYLTNESKLFISNDSGSMHIADALSKPLAVIFGSTNPSWTGPINKNSIVIKSDVACSPCYKKDCSFDFVCMNRINPDEVFEKIKKLLSKEGI